MTMFLAPYTAIADIDGSPLDAGFLFFGEYGKDPELFPVEVFWDSDFTVPAAQPIRTRNGYPVRNGSPTKVYLKTAQHSIVIKNRNSAFILVDFNNKGWSADFVVDGEQNQHQINDSIVYRCETLSDLKKTVPRKRNHTVHVYKYSSESKYVGGVNYRWEPTSTDTPNGFETIASDMTPTGRWKAMFDNGVINAWSVGFFGDGVTDNSAVHQKVAQFLHISNESWKLIFSNGDFLYNDRFNVFTLVSNVNYHIKRTAKIMGGINFDDNGTSFGRQFDTTKPLVGTSITGKGVFDMSGAGLMRTGYKVRIFFYIYHPQRFLVDGVTFMGGDFSQVFTLGETETTATSDDVLIKNCVFDAPVSGDPTSQNTDFTTIYTQTRNTVVRNNRFKTSNIRARCLSTVVEFHTKEGQFLNNRVDDYAVLTYISPTEQTDCSNITIDGNTCRLSNLFVCFWGAAGANRLINDIYVTNNKVKQIAYPDAATLSANGLFVKTEGLRFISFIHNDGFSATNRFISNGVYVNGNTFIHETTGQNTSCQLLYLFCNPCENIHIHNNTLQVNALVYSSAFVNAGIKGLTIKGNTIDSRYLSTTIAPVSLDVASLERCYFDLSDIEYLDSAPKSIPMFSFVSLSMPVTISTFIEGKGSRSIYNRTAYPYAIFNTGNANKAEMVVQTTIVVPAGVTGAVPVATNTTTHNSMTKAEILYCPQEINGNVILPDTLRKRQGDALPFRGLGYTNPALSSAASYNAWLYVS